MQPCMVYSTELSSDCEEGAWKGRYPGLLIGYQLMSVEDTELVFRLLRKGYQDYDDVDSPLWDCNVDDEAVLQAYLQNSNPVQQVPFWVREKFKDEFATEEDQGKVREQGKDDVVQQDGKQQEDRFRVQTSREFSNQSINTSVNDTEYDDVDLHQDEKRLFAEAKRFENPVENTGELTDEEILAYVEQNLPPAISDAVKKMGMFDAATANGGEEGGHDNLRSLKQLLRLAIEESARKNLSEAQLKARRSLGEKFFHLKESQAPLGFEKIEVMRFDGSEGGRE
eukprot:750607-Hanusia_phi.AAC.1